MAELAKEKSERYADNVGINTFKEALALIKEERETRQANNKIIAARTAGPAVPDPNASTSTPQA